MAKRKSSSFDRIRNHLIAHGEQQPVPTALRGDMEALVRRCDEVRSLGREYGSVELSPYMTSLLRVTPPIPAAVVPVMRPVAASL